jgi:hypothetical protein
MAKIQEELIVIKLSKLHKDKNNQMSNLANEDIVAGLEAVVQELVGNDVIVEIVNDVN